MTAVVDDARARMTVNVDKHRHRQSARDFCKMGESVSASARADARM